jgi:hypothetical protein
MRLMLRTALIGAMTLAPATAFAWLPFQPTLPEQAARDMATQYGVVAIDDVYPTFDADWKIKGYDAMGNWVEIILDGRTGAVERAVVEAR